MPDPVKPDLSPIAGGSTAGKAVATGAAKAAAGGVAKVAAWHTISLATAAALGLGGGGYYLHRDTKARSQLTEMEQQAGALEDRAKESGFSEGSSASAVGAVQGGDEEALGFLVGVGAGQIGVG